MLLCMKPNVSNFFHVACNIFHKSHRPHSFIPHSDLVLLYRYLLYLVINEIWLSEFTIIWQCECTWVQCIKPINIIMIKRNAFDVNLLTCWWFAYTRTPDLSKNRTLLLIAPETNMNKIWSQFEQILQRLKSTTWNRWIINIVTTSVFLSTSPTVLLHTVDLLVMAQWCIWECYYNFYKPVA